MNIFIAENLAILRQKNGYTMEALAEIISVSRQTIAKWEAGDSYPDILNCTKLASLYKISLDELVNKQLKLVMNSDMITEGEQVYGVVDISPEGTVPVPDSVMKLFDMQCGDKVILLADKKRGIALLKCSQL